MNQKAMIVLFLLSFPLQCTPNKLISASCGHIVAESLGGNSIVFSLVVGNKKDKFRTIALSPKPGILAVIIDLSWGTHGRYLVIDSKVGAEEIIDIWDVEINQFVEFPAKDIVALLEGCKKRSRPKNLLLQIGLNN